jgi:DNA topoisomerase I
MAKTTRSSSTASKPRPRPKAATGPSRPRTTVKARDVTGKQLVIVESPAKAKTINQYLGSGYVVMASVGHIRDLPSKAPKGSKQPVPGVDLKHNFKPTYEVLPGKLKVMTDLKRAAKQAAEIWFATDLDREGEAIAWHLAQELGVDPAEAKRVIFNAITKSEIQKAFQHPHTIDQDMVNAQQARRILDRIVGYQVSPLLWKKVARGLSAGRVQSVAVRLIVDREREIRAFRPDEYWQVYGRFSLDAADAAQLGPQWREFVGHVDDKGNGPTIKAQNGWLADHAAIKGELVECAGKKFELGCPHDQPRDLTADVRRIAEATGLIDLKTRVEENPDGKGLETTLRFLDGRVDPTARYRVKSIETKRTTARPQAPFITSSLQVAASSFLGFAASRTMGVAQSLYEGVSIRGEGQVGLITYMRTDSTALSPEAIGQARSYIGKTCSKDYLPEQANVYSSSNKAAQEAHEAIRPTDVWRTPDQLAGALTEEQLKLYRLIWNRFVGGQMTPAEWDSTAVLLERSDKPTGAVFKATGRVLVFDGFYKVVGVPTASDELTLPELAEGQSVTPFSIDPQQKFTSPPARFTEASLVKTLEAEGIGRPSTYASIIKVIQERNYVEQVSRSFHSTDLGEVVTDKLVEGFPELMDIGYTREMEGELDKIEDAHTDWRTMLHRFYGDFSNALEHAHENMTHAKAEIEPAIYQCPKCGSRTCYRFGKNGRFLSCAAYPACEYAAPIDREGHPMLPERVNIACPVDGSQMILRTGRFGEFLASINYPKVKYVINIDKKGRLKYPAPPPLVTELRCSTCESPLNLRRGARGPWLGCSRFPKCRGRLAWSKVEEPTQTQLLAALEAHEHANPQPTIRTLDGRPIPNGAPIVDFTVPGGVQELAIHPDAERERRGRAKSA